MKNLYYKKTISIDMKGKTYIHYYFLTKQNAIQFIETLDKNFIFRKDNELNDYEIQVKKGE